MGQNEQGKQALKAVSGGLSALAGVLMLAIGAAFVVGGQFANGCGTAMEKGDTNGMGSILGPFAEVLGSGVTILGVLGILGALALFALSFGFGASLIRRARQP